MESPSGQGSGDFVEVQVGAVGEGHFEDASKGEIGKPRGSSEQSLLEPVRSELEVRTSAEEEAAWTSYKDIMEDTGPPVTLTTLSEITPAENSEPDGLANPSLPVGSTIQVWVSNPKQVEDINKMGMRSSYTSYFVQCQTTLKSYPYTQRSVWRRFKDFEALHSLLRENHPGYFCPPLPSKNYIGAKRAKEDFVKTRQLDLQKFLRQITSHASLVEAEEVKLFLGIPEELNLSHEWLDVLEGAKNPDSHLEHSKLNGASTALKQDIRRTMRKVGDSFKKEVLKQNRSISADEKRLRQTAAWMRALEVELGACCQKARALVAAYEAMMTEMLNLGRSFIALARYEEESGQKCGQYTETGHAAVSRASGMQKAGYASLRVHHFYRKFVAITSQWLMILEDNLNMVPAALAGLNDREKAQAQIHDCEDQLEGTRQRLADLTRESSKKLGGTSGSMKSAHLSLEINNLVGKLGTLTAEYDRVRGINESETQLLTTQRHQSLQAMVRGLAKDQAELNNSIAVAWRALGEQLSKESVG